MVTRSLPLVNSHSFTLMVGHLVGMHGLSLICFVGAFINSHAHFRTQREYDIFLCTVLFYALKRHQQQLHDPWALTTYSRFLHVARFFKAFDLHPIFLMHWISYKKTTPNISRACTVLTQPYGPQLHIYHKIQQDFYSWTTSQVALAFS